MFGISDAILIAIQQNLAGWQLGYLGIVEFG
jgi:hypothetical protein